MHLRTNVEAQILGAVASLDFTALVSLADTSEEESYFVGSELGLITRFVRQGE